MTTSDLNLKTGRRKRNRDVQQLLPNLLRLSARLPLPQQQQRRKRLKKIAANANRKKRRDVKGKKKQKRDSGGNWRKRS